MKAVRAVIGQPDIAFALGVTEYLNGSPFHASIRFMRGQHGYRSYAQPLGLHTWHMVLVSKRPGLMLSMDEETIWQELSGSRYTTPIIRSWMPYLLKKMREYDGMIGGRSIVDAEAWGCQPGLLNATTESLDALVTEGLINGSLTI